MYFFAGDKDKCLELIGVAKQERMLTANHANAFHYRVFKRFMSFANGATITTQFLNGSVLSFIYYPIPPAPEPKKQIVVVPYENEIIRVELISSFYSWFSLYLIGKNSITRKTDLADFTHGYKIFDGYLVQDETLYDYVEANCVCVVNGVANVAADNILLPIVTHIDDWHNTTFRWLGFPYWFLSDEFIPTDSAQTCIHPGMTAGISARYVHWSHSPATDPLNDFVHTSRYIDQERRIYRPGRVDLLIDKQGDEYYMQTTQLFKHGKKPWSLNAETKKVTSYNERMVIDGLGTFQIDSGAFHNMVMFFWPFIPYMWEIPYSNVFNYIAKEAVYGRCIAPEDGRANIRKWKLEYTKPGGEVITLEKHEDSGIFTCTQDEITEWEQAERPHYIWTGEPPTATFIGSVSGTWIDHGAEHNWAYTVSLEKTVPIGTVCNTNELCVKNEFLISFTHHQEWSEEHTKMSTLIPAYYLWWPVEPGWIGGGSDTSASLHSDVITEVGQVTHHSYLKVGTTVIDSGEGVWTYNGEKSNTWDQQNTTMIVADTSLWMHTWSQTSSGFRTDVLSYTGMSERRAVGFAVLDYDSESWFKPSPLEDPVSVVAVVYKKITIENVIDRQRTEEITVDTHGAPLNGIVSNGDGFNSWANIDSHREEETEIEDTCTATGSRIVEFRLFLQIGGQTINRLLATFTGGINTGSGKRIYGVSVKIMPTHLLISYDLDTFISPGSAQGTYDSPRNYEELNDAGMWVTEARMIGIMMLTADKFGVEIFDAQSPVTPEVYGVTSVSISTKMEWEEVKNG